MKTVLETNETWCLEYTYGSPTASLGIAHMYCGSLEECQASLKYLSERAGAPRWAHAVHAIEQVTLEETVHVLIIAPPMGA